MGRRGENIRKRKDGRWEARVIAGYDLKGSAKYHSIYGKSYTEVKEKRNEWIKNSFNILSTPAISSTQKVTVNNLMTKWLEAKKHTVKESTFVHYVRIVRTHILPELGEYYISALNADIINEFLKNKLHSGKLNGSGPLSAKTVADIRSVLIQGIEFAHQQKYPCPVEGKIFYPNSQPKPIEVLSLEEQTQLERVLYAKLTPFNLGILTTLYGGLRIGEICALKWEDIHFENGTLHINKTILRIQEINPTSASKTRVTITQPKTSTSNRVIPLPTFIMKILKEHADKPDTYLLTGTSFPLEPRSCLAKYKRVLRQAGLKSFSFHTLRHTFATRCIENGFDAKSLSEILGHANINTTLQRYVHPSMELKRIQMNRLENLTTFPVIR